MRTGIASRRGKRGVALGAAAGVLAASVLGYAPGWAVTEAEDTAPPAPAATSGPAAAPTPGTGSAGLAEAGLADALLRDLGLTPEQFSAAGELGSRAAAAASQLRGVPGYSGIRLQDNRIIVSGTGAELQSAVGRLSRTLADVSLEAPGTAGSAPAPTPVPAPTVPETEPSIAASAGAPPSAAPGSQLAVSTEQLFQAYLREVGTAGLQAVVTAGGKFVIRTGSIAAAQSTQDTGGTPASPPGGLATTAAPGKISPSEFVSRYANVVLDGGAPLKPEADVPGGVGYRTDNRAICSTGFSAFDPSGLPAVLTAGHCTDDGTATTAELLLQGAPAGPLGAFQFSQLGGPGNARVLDQNVPTDQDGVALTDPGNVGTDIAVVGALRPDLDPLPAASTYGDALQPGPDVKIIGTATPEVGVKVCRSGWRTGWSCGTVSAVGIFLVGGPTYPADPADVRAFNGFLSYDVQSSPGDSGGPWISGNYAVGTHSAGDDPQPDDPAPLNFAVAATLEESLEVLPSYQLELFLNKPQLADPADSTFTAGTSITGRVPAAPASAVAAGSNVQITVPGQQPIDVPVDAAGNWSFSAPEAPGPFTFTAETVNGFSRSGAASISIVIAPASLPAPTITTPATDPLPALTSIAGTGTPGAMVALSGDVAGSGSVGPDGRWSVQLTSPAPYGQATVTAVQQYNGLADSPPATATFAVTPPAPAISSIAEGQHVPQDALPATISGTGLNGADVAVSVDGTPVSATPAGGAWSVAFPAGLAAGNHTVSAIQTVDGVASAPATVTFSIDAPAPVLPAGNIRDGGPAAAGAGGLPRTGSSALVPAAAAAAAAIAAGAVLMLLVRRRREHTRG
jgi:Trypsin